MGRNTVVLLVDDRRRDLLGNALIAWHLERRGIETHLEAINAWQAVLGAHRPAMIVFNHLSVPHLAGYSRRLHEMGVLTGILPNEGIFYDPDDLDYSSKPQCPGMHCDYFFCWNDVHREALIRNRFCASPDAVVTVGIPRFDFYREPWIRAFRGGDVRKARPVVLVCSNFPFAQFKEMPREVTDNFFAKWVGKIPIYDDYWGAIEANYAGRTRFLDFVGALLAAKRWDVVLRPHPREAAHFYERWMAKLDVEQRGRLRFAMEESITELIVDCDVQVSCENCTTTLESWIAGKPTIELALERHPFFYNPGVARLNPECGVARELPVLVESVLREPGQESYRAGRVAHLEKWCGAPDGRSAEKVAKAIGAALEGKVEPAAMALSFNDYRRGWKLKAYRLIGQPYTFFPIHQLGHAILARGEAEYSKKVALYRKSITPVEVRQALRRVQAVAPDDASMALG